MQSGSGRKILVGEDEQDVRGYFQIALKSLGYAVELAEDGDEVLSFLRSSRSEVGAVLLDLVMPNRDGIETLQEIRELDPELPVIMVSGVASSLDIVRVMKFGAADFLSKPVAHEELRRAIGRLVEPNGDACLSLPDIRVEVTRPSVISIKAMDLEGRLFEQTADGLLARIWQHEFDHLMGHIYIDRMRDFATLTHLAEFQRFWLKS